MIISALYVYPVKSLAGIALEQAKLEQQGFAGDRQWMLVKPDGKFVSQRQWPKMALIQVKLAATGLQLSAPGMSNINVNDTAQGGERIRVNIWKDHCWAYQANREVNQWLSDFLQSPQPLRLVKFDPASPRLPYQVQRFGENKAKFADAAPYLVANQASLSALNTSLLQQGLAEVSMARFRPNIVISGLPAFAEHRLQQIEADDVTLKMVDPCARCAIITVDPSSGEKSPGNVPFPQLAALNPMPQQAKVPAFGVNACLATESFTTAPTFKVGQTLNCR